MPKQLNHITSIQIDYSDTSIQDFLNGQSSYTAAFVSTKLAMAAEAMVELQCSKGFIAKKLGLVSDSAVAMLINNWGSKGKKRNIGGAK